MAKRATRTTDPMDVTEPSENSGNMEARETVKGAIGKKGEVDAIALCEAMVAAASSERYKRNTALAALAQQYRVSQYQIRELQDRLDERRAARAKR